MSDHDIVPEPGTVVRLSDCQPGNLLAAMDYPLLAMCLSCGQPIRCERMFLADWQHWRVAS